MRAKRAQRSGKSAAKWKGASGVKRSEVEKCEGSGKVRAKWQETVTPKEDRCAWCVGMGESSAHTLDILWARSIVVGRFSGESVFSPYCSSLRHSLS